MASCLYVRACVCVSIQLKFYIACFILKIDEMFFAVLVSCFPGSVQLDATNVKSRLDVHFECFNHKCSLEWLQSAPEHDTAVSN